MQKLLVRRTFNKKLLFIGELLSGGKDFKPKMDHLTCYLPGTLALGVMYGMPKNHMDLAEELLYTCYQTYAYHPTFLAPEISYFNVQDNSQPDIHVKTTDAHNLLRPEFVESLWIMYQITGNTTYQDWGWQVFEVVIHINIIIIIIFDFFDSFSFGFLLFNTFFRHERKFHFGSFFFSRLLKNLQKLQTDIPR